MNQWAGYRMGEFSISHYPLFITPGVEMSSFQNAVKRLEVDENVKRAHLIDSTLAGCEVMPSTVFQLSQSPK